MLRAPYAIAALAGLAAALEAVAQQPAVRPAYRSGVDLVSLTVTVTDPRRRFIHDLSPEHFQVMEDGRPQKVAFFTETGTSLSRRVVKEKYPFSSRAARLQHHSFASSLRSASSIASSDIAPDLMMLRL